MDGTRRAVASLLVCALLFAGGCLGVITGDEPASFSASAATVAEATLGDTGYEETRSESPTARQNFTVAGQTRTVEVTNHLTEYQRRVDLVVAEGELARFTVFTTPEVEVLGRTFNPIADRSNAELAMQVQQQYRSISSVQHVDNRSVRVLGTDATVSRFSARAETIAGQRIDVTLHVTKFTHEGDVVVAIAVHPQVLDERENVDTLLQGIEH